MKKTIQKNLNRPTVSRFRFIGVFVFFLNILSPCLGQKIAANQSGAPPLEKVYLHLDKSFYTAGEDIWFKAYTMDARDHIPQTVSEIVYVKLSGPNNQLISKKILKTNKGSAAGDFKLPTTAVSGTYTVTGYTNYMRNFGSDHFYSKEIYVNTVNAPTLLTDASKTNIDTTLDVQFFPEGGHLINGFLNPVAFKALDSNGNSASVDGKLMDGSGTLVTSFKSSHLGMGLFHFIPKKDENYSAIVLNQGKEERFQLSKALTSGVLMTVSNLMDYYKIELRATPDVKIKDYVLLGKQGGRAKFSLAVNANRQENSTIVKVMKDILTEGILELTLINHEDKPIAERLVFHESENRVPNVNISSAKHTYQKRERVVMEIALDSMDAATSTADLSLSVSNMAVQAAENFGNDIKTYLMLKSVLRGNIEQPGYYFNSNNPERQQHLDILLRTQGWRKYVLEETLVASSNYFLPEKGITLSGKVVNSNNPSEALTGSVSLTANSASEMIQDRSKTADDGTFSFNNLYFSDTTNVLLSANVYYPKKKRNPTQNYKIILDTINAYNSRSSRIDLAKDNIPNEGSFYSSGKSIAQFTGAYEKAQETTLSIVYNDKTIQLDEAFIAAKKKTKVLDKFEKKRQGMLYKEPSQTVDFSTIEVQPGQNVFLGLQGRVPGLSIGMNSILIRGGSSQSESNMPLILLDGTPINIATEDGLASLDQILPMTADEVDFIDIIKGPRAAIYGSRAANGVIAIYSKNGSESSGSSARTGGSLNFKHPGFESTRKFYTPKYTTHQKSNADLDTRTTLHWQPFVELNANRKVSISYYAGDISGEYKVVVEGISSDGKSIHSTSTISVE
jgi:hypothetical protein